MADRPWQHYEDLTARREELILIGKHYTRLYHFPVGAVDTLTPANGTIMPGEEASGIHAPRVKDSFRAQQPVNGMLAVTVIFLSAEAYE